MQLITETTNRLFPRHARIIAITRAAVAEYTLFVAERIAGKVITARVTYGT